MAFFLETLFGGLMAGMLYSLVALGFVLIFKASGVFNFAQGAMVLFAALAMARFSEWILNWLGPDSLLIANLLAFSAAFAARTSALAYWPGLMSRTLRRSIIARANSLAALVRTLRWPVAFARAFASVATKRARVSLWIALSAARSRAT